MEVRLHNEHDLIIIPETDIEEQIINMYDKAEVYVKHGLTPKETIGLVIKKPNSK